MNFLQPRSSWLGKSVAAVGCASGIDGGQTPHHRLLASGILGEDQCPWLAREYKQLNPVRLRRQLEEAWSGCGSGLSDQVPHPYDKAPEIMDLPKA